MTRDEYAKVANNFNVFDRMNDSIDSILDTEKQSFYNNTMNAIGNQVRDIMANS